ncbi:MAG TPA: hypothetical protein HPP66_05025 [Planctomycetes bacterium]|nr:hypothetical protein [Planctomycetota bacterium]
MITAKRQLLSFLILVVICVSALATEPNETKTELKFEINTRVRSKGLMKFTGPVKPKYVAIFTMSDLSRIRRELVWTDYPALAKMILATTTGQSMSEIQKELLKADRVISTSTSSVREQMYSVQKTEFGLYAFTVDDAKNMTQALIEILTTIAREKQPPMLEKFMNERKQKLQILQEGISDIKNKLIEMEPEFKSRESKYKTIKNTDRYRTLSDSKANEKARETIVQMNKMLSILDIELAGIQEKLVVIEQYRESGKFSKATLEKLEQMFVEQMVELRGAMARKDAAIELRNQDKQFCDLYNAWHSLEKEVKFLRNRLRNEEKRVRSYEEGTANPHPELLPPKVLQNKVTIYPVLAEE